MMYDSASRHRGVLYLNKAGSSFVQRLQRGGDNSAQEAGVSRHTLLAWMNCMTDATNHQKPAFRLTDVHQVLNLHKADRHMHPDGTPRPKRRARAVS